MSAGIVAAFETEEDLRTAVHGLQDTAGGAIETYTPKIVEDTPQRSFLPFVMLIAGLIGVCGAYAMETFANVSAYPWNIGGRPKFSWPSFVPIAFEIGVLSAMLAGFFGYLVAARMPKLYDPIDGCEVMRAAMRDRFLLAIRSKDAGFLRETRSVLERFHPERIEEIPE
jgi:hypothetical protein